MRSYSIFIASHYFSILERKKYEQIRTTISNVCNYEAQTVSAIFRDDPVDSVGNSHILCRSSCSSACGHRPIDCPMNRLSSASVRKLRRIRAYMQICLKLLHDTPMNNDEEHKSLKQLLEKAYSTTNNALGETKLPKIRT